MDVDDFREFAEQLSDLHDQAYMIYKPLVDAICRRTAVEAEVMHLLDFMRDFCGDERILVLFKQVCRKYYTIYPEEIEFQINAYREYYETDSEDTDDQL